MQTKVQRWGNSLAVRIPKAFADEIGVAEETAIEMSLADGDLVLSPRPARPFTLETLLARVTDENLHREVDTGPAVGDEVWQVGYVPARGDVVWLTLDPQAGHEQAGRRPAVIVSPRAYNGRVGLALCCPVTSKRKGYPFEVEIPHGLKARGVILADQIKSLDWRARRAEHLAELPEATLLEVLQKISTLLD